MCLIAFALDAHPRYRLVVAANRDEFHRRPTARADFWDDAPEVLAGRDLERGGTWLGITRGGRWSAVTSVREPPEQSRSTSRGHLVTGFLAGEESPAAYAAHAVENGDRYAGFNLLVGDLQDCCYGSNRDGRARTVDRGIHGLSNHLLDTPWPKVERARKGLAQILDRSEVLDPDEVFPVLADRWPAADAALPDTGVGPDKERLLSSIFVASPGYGTRSSTVILVDRQGRVEFIERSFRAEEDGRGNPQRFDERRHGFRIRSEEIGRR